MPDPKCPCGTNRPLTDCCKPYLDGAAEAATPELLMRSRYTAFSRGDVAYLQKTWHPGTVPTGLTDEPMNWISLAILASSIEADGARGTVEFVAKMVAKDFLAVLHEVSRFEKVAGRWVYCSGEFKGQGTAPVQVSMKTPCPCGSGVKFKSCHFRR